MAKGTSIALLRSLGFKINLIKSCLTPSQCCEFLGMLINTISMTISLPEKKVERLISLYKETMEERVISLQKLAKVLGKLQTTAPPSRSNSPNQGTPTEPHQSSEVFPELRVLHNYIKRGLAELIWWIQNLIIVKGANTRIEPPQMEIFIDTSKKAWGAHVKGGSPWETNWAH